jgi:hypothetical protein
VLEFYLVRYIKDYQYVLLEVPLCHIHQDYRYVIKFYLVRYIKDYRYVLPCQVHQDYRLRLSRYTSRLCAS